MALSDHQSRYVLLADPLCRPLLVLSAVAAILSTSISTRVAEPYIPTFPIGLLFLPLLFNPLSTLVGVPPFRLAEPTSQSPPPHFLGIDLATRGTLARYVPNVSKRSI